MKQTWLTFHEQPKVRNNCKAYCVPRRLTGLAEQKNKASQLLQNDNTGHWEAGVAKIHGTKYASEVSEILRGRM
jgi:uncharacterized cupin superfamily protein